LFKQVVRAVNRLEDVNSLLRYLAAAQEDERDKKGL
jgi:hypothetical protein